MNKQGSSSAQPNATRSPLHASQARAPDRWIPSSDASKRGQGATALPALPSNWARLDQVPDAALRQEPLRILDWAGYRAAVSYTFDDSNSSQIDSYDRLRALGVPMTFYLWTAKPESGSSVWTQALEDGHEIGNHSHSHEQHGPAAALAADLDRASAFIEEKFGVRPWTMAAPFGSRAYVPAARERFFINRGVQPGLVLPGEVADPHHLDCFVPAEGAPAEDFERRVQSARQQGGWEVVLIHGFGGGTDNAYRPSSIEAFERAVQTTKALGDVWIGTLMDIGAYWLGQQALRTARQAASAGRVTYRWTLPEHFPPGKFVRVRVNAGSLEQNGRPSREVARGVYDVALDVRELSLEQAAVIE